MSEFNVNVEVSARHVHLSQEDIEKLFGKGYELRVKKDIAGGRQFVFLVTWKELLALRSPQRMEIL